MGTGWIRRLGRGRPRLKPDRVAGDKAYSSGRIREALRRRGIGAVIPTKENEQRQPDFDREAYRERNRIERLINRLKQFRRIATRYEKRAANYLAIRYSLFAHFTSHSCSTALWNFHVRFGPAMTLR